MSYPTYDSWYRGHRCPGSPEDPKRTLSLAHATATKRFADVIEPDEVANLVMETLRKCFDAFDPAEGDKDISTEDQFVRLFKESIRRKFKEIRKEQVSQKRPRSTERYREWRLSLEPWDEEEEVVADWEKELYGEALLRMSREARDFIDYHLQGMTVDEAADRMGVPRGRLRKYERGGIAEAVGKAVGAMIRAMSPEELNPKLYRMYYQHELDADQIAALLRLPRAEVEDLIRDMKGWMVDGLFREVGRSG